MLLVRIQPWTFTSPIYRTTGGVSRLSEEWTKFTRERFRRKIKKKIEPKDILDGLTLYDRIAFFRLAAQYFRNTFTDYFPLLLLCNETLANWDHPDPVVSEIEFIVTQDGRVSLQSNRADPRDRLFVIRLKTWKSGRVCIFEQRGWGEDTPTMGIDPSGDEPAFQMIYLPSSALRVGMLLRDNNLIPRKSTVYWRRPDVGTPGETWTKLEEEGLRKVPAGEAVLDILHRVSDPSIRVMVSQSQNFLNNTLTEAHGKALLNWAAKQEWKIVI